MRRRIVTERAAAERIAAREPETRRFPANGKGLLFVPVLWFVWFVLLYALQGLGCAQAWHESSVFGVDLLRAVLGVVTLLEFLLIGWFALSAYSVWETIRDDAREEGGTHRDQSKFLAYVALMNALLFGVASMWIGYAILSAQPCGV